jgi:hypothetical protein
MVDDIDGEVATQTVPFGLDGVSYEIDLSEENAARLREELARFIAAAQRTGVRKIRLATGQSAARAGADRAQSRQIREWAREQGYGVSQRGRIPPRCPTRSSRRSARRWCPNRWQPNRRRLRAGAQPARWRPQTPSRHPPPCHAARHGAPSSSAGLGGCRVGRSRRPPQIEVSPMDRVRRDRYGRAPQEGTRTRTHRRPAYTR